MVRGNGKGGAAERTAGRALLALLAALATAESTAQTGLFEAAEPLEIKVTFDFGALCREGAEVGCPDAAATLAIRGEDGTERTLPVWIRARGRWRNVSANCSMPPLAVIFGDTGTEGTIFEGQTMLPLSTHCNERPGSQEQYVLKELTAYHIYNELTEKSMRVRLARVAYENTGRQARVVERYAFFLEHFDSMAARNGAEYFATDNFDLRLADPAELATLELFEFMIGNTDWSILKGHNVAHIRTASKAATAVPYDFDFSGIVNASYAITPPSLRIRRVTQRVYRGFCHPGLDWAALFERFQAERDAIGAAIEQTPALEAEHHAEVRAYVASFYEIIDSEERRQAQIVEACRPLADRS
jgi:hypothetical protein